MSIIQNEKEVQVFIVMAKPVGSACNLNCAYCYYKETLSDHSRVVRQASPSDSPGVMTDEVLELFIRQYIEASPGPVVNFVWHGGEPTLAGLGFFKRAVDFQKRYLPDGWEAWNNLQTNGVLLDDEWCSFLADAHFDVGLSLDGAQWLHDLYRKDHVGRGSYRAAAEAVRRLQAHGIQPDLLCTVTADAAERPLAVYRALREFNTGWIQFIPIVRRDNNGELTPDSVTANAYGNFLCAIFDEWSLHDIGQLDVQLFAEAARVWAGGTAGLCWMAPACGRALIVEQDGSVYSCDHFVDAEHRIGHIKTASLAELANLPIQRNFGDDKREGLSAQCRSCPHLAVCNGGCPKDRNKGRNKGHYALGEKNEPGQNHLCAGLKQFFTHAHPVAMQIMRLTKNGLAPATVMAELRKQARAVWKGVSRNDPCPCGSGLKAKNCCWSKRL